MTVNMTVLGVIMAKFVKSAARTVILFVVITFLSFLLISAAPGDAAQSIYSRSGVMADEEAISAARERMGLNEPLPVQYKNWLLNFLTGDMGVSFKTGRPVAEQFKRALPNTVMLTLVSMLITVLISTPIGAFCAYKKGGIFDKSVRAVTYIFASIPSFFLAFILMYIFSVKLGVLPVVSGNGFSGAVMPCVTMSAALSPWFIRQSRSVFLKELEKDYVLALRCRGISEGRILFCHIAKNAFAPLITLAGMSFGTMLGGSAVVESVFSFNGIGKLAVDAISARDYPVLQAFTVWMVAVFLLINFVVDISYKAADPRLRSEVS